FFQAEDGIRDRNVTGVQTCALPISPLLMEPRMQGMVNSNSNKIRTFQVHRSFQLLLISHTAFIGTKALQLVLLSHRLARGSRIQIGRASCRERVENCALAGSLDSET